MERCSLFHVVYPHALNMEPRSMPYSEARDMEPRSMPCSKLGEDLLGHRDSVLDVGVGVREGHEAGLVLRGGEVHAALEHASVPPRKLVGVGLGCVREALDRALGEEESEHARDV